MCLENKTKYDYYLVMICTKKLNTNSCSVLFQINGFFSNKFNYQVIKLPNLLWNCINISIAYYSNEKVLKNPWKYYMQQFIVLLLKHYKNSLFWFLEMTDLFSKWNYWLWITVIYNGNLGCRVSKESIKIR